MRGLIHSRYLDYLSHLGRGPRREGEATRPHSAPAKLASTRKTACAVLVLGFGEDTDVRTSNDTERGYDSVRGRCWGRRRDLEKEWPLAQWISRRRRVAQGRGAAWAQGSGGQSVESEGAMGTVLLPEGMCIARRSLKPARLSPCTLYSQASTDRNIHTWMRKTQGNDSPADRLLKILFFKSIDIFFTFQVLMTSPFLYFCLLPPFWREGRSVYRISFASKPEALLKNVFLRARKNIFV